MTWFLIALCAPLLWAAVNHADKYLLSKHSTEASVGALMIFSTFAGVIVVCTIPFFASDIFDISLTGILTLMSAGIIGAISIMAYLYALNEEEASIVVPLMQMIPVFGFIFGFFFLNEKLTTLQIIGSLVTILGAVIISLEFAEEEKLKLKGKVFLLMLCNGILFALYETMFKLIAIDAGFLKSTFWEHLGLLTFGLFLLVFFKKFRTDFFKIIYHKNRRFQILGLNIGSEVLTLAGNMCTNYALLLAPIAVVLLIGSFQPVFVFAMGIIMTMFFPHISQEKITTRHIIHKAISILIILIGTYLLFK
ncbi:MAG: hypothetical protein RLY57_226 [Candidatus Parcubacteria bacterium]|jgi:drug/metabolite transporter (DMT)-like permease